MRRFVFLHTLAALAAGLVLGCADGSNPTDLGGDLTPAYRSEEAQAVVRFTRQEPFEFVVESPCTGKMVDFAGEIVEQVTSIGPQELLDQGIALHFEDHAVISGTGTERVTGTTYAIRQVVNFGFNSPALEAMNLTQRFQTTIRAISGGRADNFLVHVRFHLTVLPSGEVATVADITSAQCRG